MAKVNAQINIQSMILPPPMWYSCGASLDYELWV